MAKILEGKLQCMCWWLLNLYAQFGSFFQVSDPYNYPKASNISSHLLSSLPLSHQILSTHSLLHNRLNGILILPVVQVRNRVIVPSLCSQIPWILTISHFSFKSSGTCSLSCTSTLVQALAISLPSNCSRLLAGLPVNNQPLPCSYRCDFSPMQSCYFFAQSPHWESKTGAQDIFVEWMNEWIVLGKCYQVLPFPFCSLWSLQYAHFILYLCKNHYIMNHTCTRAHTDTHAPTP